MISADKIDEENLKRERKLSKKEILCSSKYLKSILQWVAVFIDRVKQPFSHSRFFGCFIQDQLFNDLVANIEEAKNFCNST